GKRHHARPVDHDRRVKQLRLTVTGRRLERRLTGTQMSLPSRVFDAAGDPAARGWRAIMAHLKQG
ncbi:MAG: hypothetical protein ACU85U_13685, partial [Gammaproteobacteria bacterium]